MPKKEILICTKGNTHLCPALDKLGKGHCIALGSCQFKVLLDYESEQPPKNEWKPV